MKSTLLYAKFVIIILAVALNSCQKEDLDKCETLEQEIIWSASTIASRGPDWSILFGNTICLAYYDYIEWRDINTGQVLNYLPHTLYHSDLHIIDNDTLIVSGHDYYHFSPSSYKIDKPINITSEYTVIFDDKLYYINNDKLYYYLPSTKSQVYVMDLQMDNLAGPRLHMYKTGNNIEALIVADLTIPYSKVLLKVSITDKAILKKKDNYTLSGEFLEGKLVHFQNNHMCYRDPFEGELTCIEGIVKVNSLPGNNFENFIVLANNDGFYEYGLPNFNLLKETNVDISKYFNFSDGISNYFNRLYYNNNDIYILNNSPLDGEFIKYSEGKCTKETMGDYSQLLQIKGKNIIYIKNGNLICATSNLL